MNNFLIIRLSSLGDILHTLPAYSALRKKYPGAKIVWIVEDKGKEILDCVPGLDRIVTLRLKRESRGQKVFWKELSSLRKEIRGGGQTAIDFQGLLKSGFLAFLSGAKKRIGFQIKNLKEPLASLFYTHHLPEISEKDHVIGKNLKLLELAGIHENKYEFPLVIPEGPSRAVGEMLEKFGSSSQKKLVVLNVGAAWETKRWFPERWMELIPRLQARRRDIFPILLWGNALEKGLARDIGERTSVPVVPLLSLPEVLSLVNRASLVISGDTFALQAACALFRPVVGLFGPTSPKRNGPFLARDRVAFHELKCSFCHRKKCRSLECLDKISAEEVARLSLEVLEENACV